MAPSAFRSKSIERKYHFFIELKGRREDEFFTGLGTIVGSLCPVDIRRNLKVPSCRVFYKISAGPFFDFYGVSNFFFFT